MPKRPLLLWATTRRPVTPLHGSCWVLLLGWAIFTAGPHVGHSQGIPVPQEQPFTMEADVNRILVPVVVRDSSGHAVLDLGKDDFYVTDDGKAHTISGFSVVRRGLTIRNPAATAGGPATPPLEIKPDSVILPDRISVFLFDDMHFSVEDLAHARQAGMSVLGDALTGNDMAAVVSLSGRVNTGLTRDRVKLQEALNALQRVGLHQFDGMDCPNIDYYQADLIENKHDPVAIQDANRKFANCNPAVSRPSEIGEGAHLPVAERLVESAAHRALTLGHQDAQTTYAGIARFVHRMAPLPGQRTLILISPGFLNLEPDIMMMENRLIDLAVRSNVTISAMDARGLYVTELSASERSPALSGNSLQLNSEYKRNSMTQAENAMAELANGTGGTYFHNNNDLNSGLRELTEMPDCLYILELPLDGIKANGSYHRLQVKVDRPHMQVRARRGYFLPKPAKHRT